MSRSLPLLDLVQGLLERTYGMATGIDDPASFVIGDRGYRALYRAVEPDAVARSGASPGAMTLVRETGQELRANIYYPDAMIRRLEAAPPQRGLGDGNVDDFATLVEELDHLLVLAERHRLRRPVTLFELELHANVSKHLVLTRFLARDGHLATRQRVWLRHHLFDKGTFCDEDPAVRERYRDATRWAVRFLDRLPRMAPVTRLGLLRRFHAAGTKEKVELIGAVGQRGLPPDF